MKLCCCILYREPIFPGLSFWHLWHALNVFIYYFFKGLQYQPTEASTPSPTPPQLTLAEHFSVDVLFQFADAQFVFQLSFPRNLLVPQFHIQTLQSAHIDYSFSVKEKTQMTSYQSSSILLSGIWCYCSMLQIFTLNSHAVFLPWKQKKNLMGMNHASALSFRKLALEVYAVLQ